MASAPLNYAAHSQPLWQEEIALIPRDQRAYARFKANYKVLKQFFAPIACVAGVGLIYIGCCSFLSQQTREQHIWVRKIIENDNRVAVLRNEKHDPSQFRGMINLGSQLGLEAPSENVTLVAPQLNLP